MQTHIETLEFELEAAKAVLESQIGIMNTYNRSYTLGTILGGDDLQTRCSKITFEEYRDKHIPRTKRLIAALRWVIHARNT